MVGPTEARRIGITVRAGLFTFALLLLSFIFAAIFSHTAHALGLPSLSVNLPTGNLLSPVTNTVNKVTDGLGLPVSVNSTPQTLGTDVSIPLGSQPLQASVNVPLPSIVPKVTDTASKVVSPATQTIAPVLQSVADAAQPRTSPLLSPLRARASGNASPQVQTTSSKASSPSVSQTHKPSTALSGDDERSVAAVTIAPLISGATNFIGSTIPSAVDNLIKNITGQSMNTWPLVISAGIFLLMLTLIAGLVYALNHYKVFTVGDGRFAQLAQSYDLTQLSVLIVVILGTGIIATYLILTHM